MRLLDADGSLFSAFSFSTCKLMVNNRTGRNLLNNNLGSSTPNYNRFQQSCRAQKELSVPKTSFKGTNDKA